MQKVFERYVIASNRHGHHNPEPEALDDVEEAATNQEDSKPEQHEDDE
jgi:hypothetical protein